MLLADERRPQHVVDAAIEDDDDRPIDRLAIDDAREVRAGRPDQEAAGLEQQARVRRARDRSPSRGDLGEAGAEADQVERFLVRLVRDAEPAAGVDQPKRACRPTGRAGGRRGPSPRRARRAPPASRTFDAPKACSPSSSRCGEATARRADSARSAASIPNLPAPSSPTRRTRSSRACSETAARSRTGWTRPAAAAIASRRASSPGDSTVTARIPAVTAARELVVALARAGHHDPIRRRSPPGARSRARRRRRRRPRAPAGRGARRPRAPGSP